MLLKLKRSFWEKETSALTYKWMDSVYIRRKDSYTSAGLSVRRKALKQMFRGESE